MKKRIILVGSKGKMGQILTEILKSDFDIVGVEKGDSIFDFSGDLVLDFGLAESSVISAKYCEKHKIPLIVGSTGQSQKQIEAILNASKTVPVMFESNFSVGVAFLKRIIKIIAPISEDIFIIEKHHKHKKDSPSGTAIALMNCIENITQKPAIIFSIRGGEEIGTHSIDFYFGSEVLSVTHQAFSRKAFTSGVVQAVNFMTYQTQPKLYHFDEILQIEKK